MASSVDRRTQQVDSRHHNATQDTPTIVGYSIYPLRNVRDADAPRLLRQTNWKGSHGIQERLPVDKSKSITFGNDTAGMGDTTVMSKVSATVAS